MPRRAQGPCSGGGGVGAVARFQYLERTATSEPSAQEASLGLAFRLGFFKCDLFELGVVKCNFANYPGFKKRCARGGSEKRLVDHMLFVFGNGKSPWLALAVLDDLCERAQ